MLIINKSDYAERLETLQPPMPPPARCQQLHCDAKPICFTDYAPHFPQTTKIASILVGFSNWSFPNASEDLRSEFHLKGGYQDSKLTYLATNEYSGEIHFTINIVDKDFMWLFGEYNGGSFLQVADLCSPSMYFFHYIFALQ